MIDSFCLTCAIEVSWELICVHVVSDPSCSSLLQFTVCIQCILQLARLCCGVHSEEVAVGHTHSIATGPLLIPNCQLPTPVPCCSSVLTQARRYAAGGKTEEDVQGKDEEPTAVSLSG